MGAHLVFAKKGQVEQDLDRVSVGGQDDELANAAVQSLGSCWQTGREYSQHERADASNTICGPSLAPFLSCLERRGVNVRSGREGALQSSLIVRSLLHQIENLSKRCPRSASLLKLLVSESHATDLVGEVGVGQRKGLWVRSCCHRPRSSEGVSSRLRVLARGLGETLPVEAVGELP